jgi:hypothetical protein
VRRTGKDPPGRPGGGPSWTDRAARSRAAGRAHSARRAVRIARRIAHELGPEFRVTAEELEVAARSAYRTARHDWNESRAPEILEFDG